MNKSSMNISGNARVGNVAVQSDFSGVNLKVVQNIEDTKLREILEQIVSELGKLDELPAEIAAALSDDLKAIAQGVTKSKLQKVLDKLSPIAAAGTILSLSLKLGAYITGMA